MTTLQIVDENHTWDHRGLFREHLDAFYQALRDVPIDENISWHVEGLNTSNSRTPVIVRIPRKVWTEEELEAARAAEALRREPDTWHKLLKNEVEYRDEDWSTLTCTLDDETLHKDHAKHRDAEYAPFTAWTENWVYFPIEHEEGVFMGSAPRNPCDIALDAQ